MIIWKRVLLVKKYDVAMDCFVTLITNIVAAITKHACGFHKIQLL